MRLINRKIQTALDVLQVLHAEGAEHAPISRHVLAKRLHESPQWLGFVLSILSQHRFVIGTRGGGYRIAPDAGQRTLRALFNALEREYVTSIARARESASERVSLAIATLLERVTLDHILSVSGEGIEL